ncbi:MAG: hypothetical protein M5U33_03965 [Pseudorhodoplanes sp.]|nr:hypothetical protein [Pseudorhodoplanes sp.]
MDHLAGRTVHVVVLVRVDRQRLLGGAGPNRRRYSGLRDTSRGSPVQQTWPARQITRSVARITTCRSWLTIRTPQPSRSRSAAISR